MHKNIAISAVAISALLTACFNPTHQEGLACSEDGLCPDGLTCAADQICRMPEATADSGQTADGAIGQADASTTDAATVECLFTDTTICAAGPLQPAIVIPIGMNDLLDTDVDDRCADFMSGGRAMCLIYTERFDISIGASLRVTGSRPLFVASRSTITINGRLNGSSSRTDGLLGPGSNDDDCALLLPGEDSEDGGGGGAGGSFQGRGGDGGRGDYRIGPGTAGANAAPLLGGIPDDLRGGCPGSSGGEGGINGAPEAKPGEGGGGMGFVSLGAFTVSPTGALMVNGSGALRGTITRGGGGGGGSGGMLQMEAPLVRLQGLVLAEGGGGGGGANTSENGNPGLDPSNLSSGAGGSGADSGNEGDEGDGGEGSTTNARGDHSGVEGIDGQQGRRGAGGGGGGAGYLFIIADSLQISGTSPGITLRSDINGP